MLGKDIRVGMMFLEPCSHVDPTCECSERLTWTVLSVEPKTAKWRDTDAGVIIVNFVNVRYLKSDNTVEEIPYGEETIAWNDSELMAVRP